MVSAVHCGVRAACDVWLVQFTAVCEQPPMLAPGCRVELNTSISLGTRRLPRFDRMLFNKAITQFQKNCSGDNLRGVAHDTALQPVPLDL